MLKEKLVPLTENKAKLDMQKMIDRMLLNEESFAIWGAGNTGHSAITYLQKICEKKLKPQYIIDNNPSLWKIDGIISPDDFFKLEKQPENLLICVYVAEQVVQQVKELGYTGNVMIFSTLVLFDTRKRWQLYERNMSSLEEVYEMLADDKSRETVVGFLNSIRSGEIDYLEKVNENSQLKTLDPMLLQYTDHEVFADIGAFTGDTILKFLELTGRKYKRIIGFELDKQNFEVLMQTVNEMEDVSIKNVAVGATSGKISFFSGRSESSALSQQGDSEADMVTLDDVVEMQDVTFLKISVCGMELSVLQGAEKLLKNNTPKIATYTSGELLWKIPMYLKKIVPDYKLFFRHYGQGLQGMVCYAVSSRTN